jgi:cytochrome o ubiquinol oxidase operon protein cyoD
MQEHASSHGTFKSYSFGFLSALILTLLAYFIGTRQPFAGWVNDSLIGSLALLQTWILLYVFLDVGKEPKPQWNLLVFAFTAMVTLILIIGSMWIMHHLNYNLMVR